MLRRVVNTLFLAAIVTGTALADAQLGGVARQLSMGGGAVRGIAVNPFIWNDPIQMYINPAFGDMYKDYVWMNAGGGGLTGTTTGNDGYGLQHGGMNFSLGDGLTLGTILSHDPTLTNAVAGAISPGGFGINTGLTLSPVEVMQFMASYGWDHSALGVRLLYGWSSNDNIASGGTTTGTNEFTASVFGVSAGIYHDMGDGNAVEGSVSFASSTAEDVLGQSTTPATADASGTEFGVTARAKLRVNNKVNVIPVVAFASASGDGSTGGTTPTTADVSGTSLGVGVGADLTVGDVYLAGGVSYGMTDMETTTTPSGGVASTSTSTTTGFPVFQFGAEWMCTDWLTTRVGYVRSFTTFKSKSESMGVSSETNFFQGWSTVGIGGYNADNLVVFGLAGSFGDFGFEATVSESAIRRGFAIVGSSDNLNSFGYFTVNYNVP